MGARPRAALRRDGGVARAKDHCAHAGQTDVILPHALYDPVGPDGGDTGDHERPRRWHGRLAQRPPLDRLGGVAEGDPTTTRWPTAREPMRCWKGPFTVPADALVAGENVVAVEVHQINPTSSDIVFGLTLDLEGGNVPAFTPGAANNVVASLPDFPTLRLNEVVTRNTSGLADRDGARELWLELVNTGADTVNLDGLFLTDDYANLTKWAFPAGHSIAGGGFLVIFADGETSDTVAAELHTNFRLPTTSGANWSLGAGAHADAQPVVLDYLSGTVGAENEAVGRTPDGRSILGRCPAAADAWRVEPGFFVKPRAPVLGELPDRRVIEALCSRSRRRRTIPDAPPQRLSFETGERRASRRPHSDPARARFPGRRPSAWRQTLSSSRSV